MGSTCVKAAPDGAPVDGIRAADSKMQWHEVHDEKAMNMAVPARSAEPGLPDSSPQGPEGGKDQPVDQNRFLVPDASGSLPSKKDIAVQCASCDIGDMAAGKGVRLEHVEWTLRDLQSMLRQPGEVASSHPFKLGGYTWLLSMAAQTEPKPHVVLWLQLRDPVKLAVRLRICIGCTTSGMSFNIDAKTCFNGREERWSSGPLLEMPLLDKVLASSGLGTGRGKQLSGELTVLPEVAGEAAQDAVVERPFGSFAFPHSVIVAGTVLLSAQPLVFTFERFLTDEECKHLKEKAEPNLKRSLVSGRTVSENRTSWSMFMTGELAEDAVVQGVDRRVVFYAGYTGTRGVQDKEKLQIIRYLPGQEFKPHYDNEAGDCSKRAATMLLFLSSVESGGETYFPKGTLLQDSKRSTGFGVKPRQGRAFIFWSRKPNGEEDPQSLHAGSKVVVGEKWVASKWITVTR